MPLYFESVGLTALAETDEAFDGLVANVVSEGKAIVGYYGLPYLNRHMGQPQFICRTGRDEESGKLKITGIDLHCEGYHSWRVRINEEIKEGLDDDPLGKILLIEPVGHRTMAIVHVVNADVLPSYMRGEVIEVQPIAFATEVHYY